MDKCLNCPQPMKYLYENGSYGLIFMRKSGCFREFRAIITELKPLPPDFEPVSRSEHNCSENLTFMAFTESGELEVFCHQCGRSLVTVGVKFEHFQGLDCC